MSAEVSRAVWAWREGSGSKSAVTGSSLRVMIVRASVVLASGFVVFFLVKARIAGSIILSLGSLSMAAALWLPRVSRAIDSLMILTARGVGVFLTWLLLVPFFYLVFAPARALLVIRGKDPMKRRFLPDQDSYWIDRADKEGQYVDRSTKQY